MTTEWCRHMFPDKVLGIEMPNSHCDWKDYNPHGLQVVPLRQLTDDVIADFLRDLDVCYMAETDYNPYRPAKRYVSEIAREVGCKLILHVMPELCRFAGGSPNFDPDEPPPDLIVLPSSWLHDRFPPDTLILPFPVNRSLLQPRPRNQGRRFLHVAGRAAMADRAGTNLVKMSQPRAEVSIHIEMQQGNRGQRRGMSMAVRDRPDYHGIYANHDVLLHPRRYGGQSLPLMEAASSAMPIIALDRSPENEWLPAEALIPITTSRPKKMLGGTVHVSDARPQALAAKIDELASDDSLVQRLSKHSDELAASWSWQTLGPRWRSLLESL